MTRKNILYGLRNKFGERKANSRKTDITDIQKQPPQHSNIHEIILTKKKK